MFWFKISTENEFTLFNVQNAEMLSSLLCTEFFNSKVDFSVPLNIKKIQNVFDSKQRRERLCSIESQAIFSTRITVSSPCNQFTFDPKLIWKSTLYFDWDKFNIMKNNIENKENRLNVYDGSWTKKKWAIENSYCL